MASVLHRLGRWCANHPWRTILAWVLVMVAAGTAAAALMKPLSNEFSIPGSRFEAVLQDLEAALPEAAGASGSVVFTSEGGFSDDEEQAVADLIADWREMDGVTAVTDPFQTQAEMDGSADQITQAREQLQQGRTDLNAGWEELRTGQSELDAGWAQYEGGLAALEENRDGLPAEMVADAEAQLAEAREQLEAGQAELDSGRQELEAGAAELDAGEAELALGERMANLSNGMQFVSDDGTVALSQLQFDFGGGPSLDPDVTAQLQELGGQLEGTGVTIDYSQSIVQDISSVVGATEAIGIAVAAIVLLIMLGGVLAAGLPLLMAMVGVGVGVGGAMALTQFVDMNSATPALALMLGLAVGIDYSLFLINRHRTQLQAGMELKASIALATGTSGNAVVFAGMTVFIALAALVVTGIPFLGVMGLVAAGTVLVAVLLAITLTPALLSLMGTRVLGRKGLSRHGTAEGPKGRGWAAWVQGRPWAAVAAVLVIVGLMAIPALDLRLGLPDGSSDPEDSTSYAAYDLTREHFGAGANGPIIAVASLDDPLADTEQAAMQAQVELGEDLANVPGAQSVVPIGVSDDRSTLVFQIVPEGGPAEQVTVDLVGNLDNSAELIGAEHGATLGFTGQTVANIDISEQLAQALPVYLLVVVGLSLVLLLLVFRSLLVPLLATGGFLLSIAAAFGAVVATYQWGVGSSIFGVHEPGPILSFLPILLIGVLFGLAMDYQVFLVSAMREAHVHGEDARQAVVSGFNHSARVVTAAAIIMISVFGGFIFAHLAMVRPIGMGLAVGVLVDAFLVRMTLTPAVLSLLGEKAWYLPRWLDRILPVMDVEGAKLERQLGVDTYPDGDVDVMPDDAEAAASLR
ncbi:MMPL family transporter [Ornithinimicrobium ciconiae]|uniref:MMPL family transporter n=1 Tax=Ornithinimicrobium ciconiae TaxID=2594265 RepID=A0A516GAU8_9MICO|nr:MMPL family transporter [Ornithinimicrobium ciconiae]QDO88622.1 MMPL family transporter [Ornithinimicrobium ciconiae]